MENFFELSVEDKVNRLYYQPEEMVMKHLLPLDIATIRQMLKVALCPILKHIMEEVIASKYIKQ